MDSMHLGIKEYIYIHLNRIKKEENKTIDDIVREFLDISLLVNLNDDEIEYLVNYLHKDYIKLTYTYQERRREIQLKRSTHRRMRELKEDKYHNYISMFVDLLRLHQLRTLINNNIKQIFKYFKDPNIRQLILSCF